MTEQPESGADETAGSPQRPGDRTDIPTGKHIVLWDGD